MRKVGREGGREEIYVFVRKCPFFLNRSWGVYVWITSRVKIYALYILSKCTVCCLEPCAFFWSEQPSNEALTCDPQGAYIRMKCSILSVESVPVVWLMTNSTDDAGIDGNEIVEGGLFSLVPSTTKGNMSFASLAFLAEESTFGYYWCEVTLPAMNMASSPIVAVISNNSLPLCSDIAVPYDPPTNTNMDCAVEGFRVSEIATSLPPTTLYSTRTNEYSFSPTTTVCEVLI